LLPQAGVKPAGCNDGFAFFSCGETGSQNMLQLNLGDVGHIKESNSVVTPCGLHSCLRQRGKAFGLGSYGPVETGPFRFLPQRSIYTLRARPGMMAKQTTTTADFLRE
jgi:hypothetical protein